MVVAHGVEMIRDGIRYLAEDRPTPPFVLILVAGMAAGFVWWVHTGARADQRKWNDARSVVFACANTPECIANLKAPPEVKFEIGRELDFSGTRTWLETCRSRETRRLFGRAAPCAGEK